MPKAKFRSRAGKKGSGPVYTLKDAVGKDNPCAEDAAPDAAIRTAKQPPKGHRARNTRKRAAHA